MVNKKFAEMVIVYLSCHFGMGLLLQEYLHIIGQEVPRWRFSMIHVYLQWQELNTDLSWVAWGLGTRIQRAWDFQLVICKHIAHFWLTLTLTIQDAYDRQWELKANKYHTFWKVYKTCLSCLLCKESLFYFYVESSSSTLCTN